MTKGLDWERDGKDWPNHGASRFVEAGGYRWHVQRTGAGPQMLLLHGTGASTHSWAGLLPLLARGFEVLAMDLPGHAFTGMYRGSDLSVAGMTRALQDLLQAETFRPVVLVGHSAGAAIAITLANKQARQAARIVGLNAALVPFSGSMNWVAPLAAKAMALNPLIVNGLSQSARDLRRIRRLIRATGSDPPEMYLGYYQRLFRSPQHVRGTLMMMANWKLGGLLDSLEASGLEAHLLAGEKDGAVPAAVSLALASRYAHITAETLPGLGHLAHEEEPDRIAVSIRNAVDAPMPHERAAS
ncbi:MAG: alpha/beta fold hydrolase BchO [Hyphomonas sp.]|jgi:magnesium chelatase accessory protein